MLRTRVGAKESCHADSQGTAYTILAALCLSHFLNDLIQSLIPAIYPMLKNSLQLNYSQIGLITLAFQLTASLLQPIIGLYTDRYPQPYSLAVGMGFTLAGLLALSVAGSFSAILVSVVLVGLGSSVFHPESSRMARAASGGRHGLAQSVFQVGGNAGTAIGPLLAAFIVIPGGQSCIAGFSSVAIVAAIVLFGVGRWYVRRLNSKPTKLGLAADRVDSGMTAARVSFCMAILICLVFSKYIYLVSFSSYYTFYLIDKFGVSVQAAQIYLFIFLGAVAIGTVGGGAVGDRLGYKTVIWISILGVLPFTLVLPHVNLLWTAVLTVPIGLILASAFSAILVYAQELLPGRVGLVAGLFFGLAFGVAGLGAAVLGWLADATSIQYVYGVCAYLPLIGLLTGLLPSLRSDV